MDSPSIDRYSLAEIRRITLQKLGAAYSPHEAQAIVRQFLNYFLPEWQMLWLTSGGRAPFPSHLLSRWEAALGEALKGRPLAYILGETIFLGHRVRIRPGVFIPRPETEEWIAWLIEHLAGTPPKTILEVGCGSGALLIALGKAFPQATLFALDHNPRAILLTRENGLQHGLHILTARHDFLQSPLPPEWQTFQWDLIVSNPPYIPFTHRDAVAPNVLAYEPHDALFCQDIEFYEKLADLGAKNLSPSGLLLVELYPPAAEKVYNCYRQKGFQVTMHKDLAGRWRWAVASLGEKACNFGVVSGSSSAR